MQQIPGAVGRQVLSKPQQFFTPFALHYGPAHTRKPGSSSSSGGPNGNAANGPNAAHGAVIATAGAVGTAINEFDVSNFGSFNAASNAPPPLPSPHASRSQSTMTRDNVGIPAPPQSVRGDTRQLTMSTQMSLSFEQNTEIFGEDLRHAAALAPQFGFDTAQHIANMEHWQRDALRSFWPEVDALFAKASRLYKNTRKPDAIEKFAAWLTRHDKDLEKFNCGTYYVCLFCQSCHHGGDEFRFHIWQHAHEDECRISDMRRLLKRSEPLSKDHSSLMDVDTLQACASFAAQEDFQMTDATFAVADTSSYAGWPQSDASQYIFNAYANDFWGAPMPPSHNREAELIAESFFATSPEPPTKDEDTAMDEDEATDGAIWCLPESFPAQQQVSVAKHFHNYGPAETSVDSSSGPTSTVSVKIEDGSQNPSPSGLQILSDWKESPVGSMSPMSSSASIMDAALTLSNLVQDYDQLYADSSALQQHWVGVVGLMSVADKLNKLVCTLFYKSVFHYSATCDKNVDTSLPEARQEKKLRSLRKSLRRHAYDQRFFNSDEAACEIRSEFSLPDRFDPFLSRLSQLTWHLLLCEPIIQVVCPEQQERNRTYIWPPLVSKNRIVHGGHIVPR